MELKTLTLGGWYQRTSLHLTEVYDLFARGFSKLPLNQNKLSQLKENLDLVGVTRETGYLEHISAKTTSGIQIRYFEDGLYTLTLPVTDIKVQNTQLLSYYQEN